MVLEKYSLEHSDNASSLLNFIKIILKIRMVARKLGAAMP